VTGVQTCALPIFYAQLGQFSKRTPTVDEVATLDVLKATADARPRIG
jgi:NitT/TauT family transport system substrate-binding protein